MTGSADLYGDDGRSAYNSVNFITCHDGFTLCDLVSYGQKHNEANQEQNRDGTDDNNSWNCGVEGDTRDGAVIRLRKQLVKNYACMLFFSLGTPMMLGGDECLRTQRGNNNAYCQDNEQSWFDWDRIREHADIVRFFGKTIAFARAHRVLRQRKFCSADARSDGGDYCLFIILHGGHQPQSVRIPPANEGAHWRRVIDTSLAGKHDFLDPGDEVLIEPPDVYRVNPRSTVVLITEPQ